jgi:S-DNA-T family DNA segregation ATPase FtsK/SpoIIIE
MAVIGAPRTGKSTLLRTLMAAIALVRTPLEVQFYVLDFGGGTFSPLSRLAHCAGVAARTDPEAVGRTVAEVRSLLNARELYFREAAIDSIETYRARRARGEADDGYGDIFLFIDGIGTLRAEFSELEEAVADITARGLTYGIHVVISGVRWAEIRQNVKDMVGTRLELRLGDAADSECGRKNAANVPASIPGRGLVPAGDHMMGALPRVDGVEDPATLADGVEGLIVAVNSAWLGPEGPKLRLLPTMLPLEELQARAAEYPDTILLGVDEADLAPCGVTPAEEPHLFLYGDSGSGKSTMLRAVAAEVMRLYTAKEAQFFVVDYRRSLLGDIPDEYVSGYLTGHDATLETFAAVGGYLKGRLPGPDVTAAQLRDRSWWSGAEVFVLIDDYDLVATSQGNPLSPLVPLLAQAGDVGLHLVLTRRAGGASRASYDPVIQKLGDLGATGVLLSGSPDEGQLMGRVKATPAPPGRAKVISRSRGVYSAQLAYQAKAAADA